MSRGGSGHAWALARAFGTRWHWHRAGTAGSASDCAVAPPADSEDEPDEAKTSARSSTAYRRQMTSEVLCSEPSFSFAMDVVEGREDATGDEDDPPEVVAIPERKPRPAQEGWVPGSVDYVRGLRAGSLLGFVAGAFCGAGAVALGFAHS